MSYTVFLDHNLHSKGMSTLQQKKYTTPRLASYGTVEGLTGTFKQECNSQDFLGFLFDADADWWVRECGAENGFS